VLVLELLREARLADLALQRPLAPDVEVPHQLLGDGRAALDRLARLEVLESGTEIDFDGVTTKITITKN